jgi:hypothetical protein
VLTASAAWSTRTWQRYLATLLGSHSEATAAVLGLFLGGLAVGYSLFGAITRRLVARAQRQGRAAPLLIVYGAVEASIGAFALIFPVLFTAVQSLSFGSSRQRAWALPSTCASRAGAAAAGFDGRHHPDPDPGPARSLRTPRATLVYAFNTAGAFAGRWPPATGWCQASGSSECWSGWAPSI